VSKFFKNAGLLDTPQKQLAVDVWDSKKKLIPQLKDHIISELYKILPKDQVKALYLIGSITGYKYTDTSDIDINVHIDPFDETIDKQKLTGNVNGFLGMGSRHPVNFFVQPYTPETSWQDAMFGVYEILSEKWINDPPLYNTIRNPQDQFDEEIIHAKSEARRFERKVLKVRENYRKYKQACCTYRHTNSWETRWFLSKKRRELLRDFRDLIRFVDRVEKNRKMVYGIGWGVPRRNYHNIVFKYIEHGPYGNFFKKLQPLNIDEHIIL